MSSLIENRACMKNGPCIHFRDFSWKKKIGSWKLYKGYCRGELEMDEVIIKVLVQDIWTEEDCDREIKKYEQIKEWATEFNHRFNTKIKVRVPRKAIIDRTACVHGMKFRSRTLSRDEWVLVFEKTGKNLRTFVARKGTTKGCSTLDAFIHFTYKQSGGTAVVSKLRGVVCRGGYIISQSSLVTDPGDVKTVMENHTCSSYCQEFPNPQDLSPVSERIPTPVQASAPPAEDPESDDDVFCDNILLKDRIQFSLEMDSTHQIHAIPYRLYPLPDYNHIPSNGHYGMPQYCRNQPPAYSSHCPHGHRAVSCGSPDRNGNFAQPWCFDDILLMGDTAPVQQASLVNGLS